MVGVFLLYRPLSNFVQCSSKTLQKCKPDVGTLAEDFAFGVLRRDCGGVGPELVTENWIKYDGVRTVSTDAVLQIRHMKVLCILKHL